MKWIANIHAILSDSEQPMRRTLLRQSGRRELSNQSRRPLEAAMMNGLRSSTIVFAMAGLIALSANDTHARTPDTPAAATRSSASNFKDMALSICISRSLQGQAATDAAGSAHALVEWTRYDAEKAPEEIDRLVNRFLARNYRTPLGEHEGPVAEFNLLKCLDLYHSRDLDSLSKRVVLPQQHREKR